MKYTGQISTGQYEFLAFELESDDPIEAVASLQSLKTAFSGGEGVSNKEIAATLYEYCLTGKVAAGGNTYENLSLEQKLLVKEVQKLIRAKN